MEAGRILGLHQVDEELSLALSGPDVFQLVVGGAGTRELSSFRRSSPSGRPWRCCATRVKRFWICSTRSFISCFGEVVAALAGAVDVEHRAAHPVVGDLQAAFAFVRHVAIGAGHAGAGVDALVPELELGMLRLEHGRAGLLVGRSPCT